MAEKLDVETNWVFSVGSLKYTFLRFRSIFLAQELSFDSTETHKTRNVDTLCRHGIEYLTSVSMTTMSSLSSFI